MTPRIPIDVVRDMLANVATPPPWRVVDHGDVRSVAGGANSLIAADVGDDAPLMSAAPGLAADLIDAHAALAAMREERDAAVASHAALAAAVREYLGAVDTERECDRRRLAREPALRDASGAIVRYQALGTVQRETRTALDAALAAAGGGR